MDVQMMAACNNSRETVDNDEMRLQSFLKTRDNCRGDGVKERAKTIVPVIQKVVCSEMILKFLVCVCYGIHPSGFSRHEKKRKYSLLTGFISLLHWCCFMSYLYFVNTYWNDIKYGPVMPGSVKVIQMGLAASGAFNLVLFALFLYSKKNDFTDRGRGGFHLVPHVKFTVTGCENLILQPTMKDWVFTNVFLLFGFCCASFVIFVDFYYNIFYSFPHMHDFVGALAPWRKLHYHIAVSTEFFGFYATACAICTFHVITCDILHHIDITEYYILNVARDREDFQKAHNALCQYGHELLQSIKWWFNIHTFFFFFLVTAMLFEWLMLLQKDLEGKQDVYKLMLSQISGSLFVAFKFAFPFLSASRVTARYSAFYYSIARKSRIPDLPNLTLLHARSGVKIIGIRITTTVAVAAFLCSFLGALKLISGWRE